MFKGIGYQLLKIADADYDGNKSAMARDLDKSPQLMYQYTKSERSPGADFLTLLHEKGYNVNWVLSDEGSMHINDSTDKKLGEPDIKRYIEEEDLVKTLKIIMQRLDEVDYGKEVKLQILKETLERIVIEQNSHFLEEELRDKHLE